MNVQNEIMMLEILSKEENRYHDFILKYLDSADDEITGEIYDEIMIFHIIKIMDAYEVCAKAYYEDKIDKDIFINVHGKNLLGYVHVLVEAGEKTDLNGYVYIKRFLKEAYETKIYGDREDEVKFENVMDIRHIPVTM